MEKKRKAEEKRQRRLDRKAQQLSGESSPDEASAAETDADAFTEKDQESAIDD